MMKAECDLKREAQEAAFVRLPLRGQRRLEIAALDESGWARSGWR
jgi:predicted unusual protein kinase regulating ubiquinone biosynthesis (AarF/ABC1/UbiB family)